MKKFLTAAVAAWAVGGAWAEYPDRPITVVVPFTAGGPTDKVARDLAEALRKPLGGATLLIENVGGAGEHSVRPKRPRPHPTATRCCCTTSAWPPRPRSTRACPARPRISSIWA